jgi:hypothetical protein
MSKKLIKILLDSNIKALSSNTTLACEENKAKYIRILRGSRFSLLANYQALLQLIIELENCS